MSISVLNKAIINDYFADILAPYMAAVSLAYNYILNKNLKEDSFNNAFFCLKVFATFLDNKHGKNLSNYYSVYNYIVKADSYTTAQKAEFLLTLRDSDIDISNLSEENYKAYLQNKYALIKVLYADFDLEALKDSDLLLNMFNSKFNPIEDSFNYSINTIRNNQISWIQTHGRIVAKTHYNYKYEYLIDDMNAIINCVYSNKDLLAYYSPITFHSMKNSSKVTFATDYIGQDLIIELCKFYNLLKKENSLEEPFSNPTFFFKGYSGIRWCVFDNKIEQRDNLAYLSIKEVSNPHVNELVRSSVIFEKYNSHRDSLYVYDYSKFFKFPDGLNSTKPTTLHTEALSAPLVYLINSNNEIAKRFLSSCNYKVRTFALYNLSNNSEDLNNFNIKKEKSLGAKIAFFKNIKKEFLPLYLNEAEKSKEIKEIFNIRLG